MLDWLIRTSLETSVLIGVVLLARPLIRRAFGAVLACDLWLIPAIGVLLPTRPPRPETALETIRWPGEELSRGLYSATEALAAPNAIPWEALWLAGVVAWVAVQLFRSAHFRRDLLATARPFVPSSAAIVGLLDRYRVSGARVFMTTRSGAPFVAGLFKPKVFLPTDFAQRFSAQEQQWVLIHELTHLRRRDLWARFVAEGFRALFWFNPLVHLAVHLLRQDQEYACDQAVVSRCTPHERYCYGRALMLGTSQEARPSFVTFFRNNTERYAMLGKYRESAWNTVVGMAVCLAVGVYSLTSAPTSVAQDAGNSGYDLGTITELQAEVHMAKFSGEADATLRVVAPDQSGRPQEWLVVLQRSNDVVEALRASGVERPALFFAPGKGYRISGSPSLDPNEHRLLAWTITRPDGAVWRRFE
ncbi:MAG TPA: M56 family metallopeptidase [Gammaproteobacteria bacterium]|nr:M56 family metallopeptidase [Gammaproteobacteria bacterium]